MTSSTPSPQGDALLDINDEYALAPEQIAAFRRDGHILLRNVASREAMATYRPAILEVAQKEIGGEKPSHERDTLGKAFLQLFHFCRKDERVARFVLARRFAKVAADLMGVDAVRLYHDQVLFKEPGGGPTPWHQDQYYIPLDTPNVLTMWIPLVDVSQEMGTMSHASGSHHDGPLLALGISDASDAEYQELLDKRKFPIVEADDVNAGDASFHTGWTVHRAAGNETQTMREVMTILYFADGARLLPDDPDSEFTSTFIGQMHLGGRGPGELVDSEVNPIVFQR
jgi:ectoine hydroxylase-related dioxygenase (phytanoyl-CoA dioxygenase family)